MSFFRKVNFSWSISDDASDRVKIEETLNTLRHLNDRLETIIPSSSRTDSGADLTRRLVGLKMLSITAEPTELRTIGEITATQGARAEFYQQIHNAAMLKAMRLEGVISQSELQGAVLDEQVLVVGPLTPPRGKQTRTLCRLRTGRFRSLGRTDAVFRFPARRGCTAPPPTDRHSRGPPQAGGTTLLQDTPQLPRLHPLQPQPLRPGLLPPDFCGPNRESIPLYSLLPTTSRRDLAGPFGMHKRIISRSAMPTLEGRYRLAHAVAGAVLSLLSGAWVHKSLCSWNILLFRSESRPGGGGGGSVIDFARPLIVGFGVSRRERPGEVTVDTRDPDSPLRLWQHPDLLRGSSGAHVRFRPKHDVYALGLVLFEIAMWQDLPSFDVTTTSSTTSSTGSSNSSGDNGREDRDLHAYLLNYSAVVAHRMGTAYRDAMMACLDDESRWDEEAGGQGQGQDGRMALVFEDEVVARLLLCVEGV